MVSLHNELQCMKYSWFMRGKMFEKLPLCNSSTYIEGCSLSCFEPWFKRQCVLNVKFIQRWDFSMAVLCVNPAAYVIYKILTNPVRKWNQNTQAMNRRQSLSIHLVHSSLSMLSRGFLVLYLKVIWLAGGMMPRPARLLSSITSFWFSSNCISHMSKVTHTNCFSSFMAKKRPGHCVAPEPKGIR